MRLWPASGRRAGRRRIAPQGDPLGDPSPPDGGSDAGTGRISGTPALDGMSRGAGEMQRRLDEARRALRDRIPPPDDD